MTAVEGDSVKIITHNFGPWKIEVQKSHILQSRCVSPEVCSSAKTEQSSTANLCTLCKFGDILSLPQLPEMTFPNNVLSVTHECQCGIEFNCLDALKLVDNKSDPMKVAIAEAWQEARAENSHIRDIVKPFDWTFSTDYKGTFIQSDKALKVSSTTERIDIEKLKLKEKIMFYDEVILFEDELADNGTAQCSVKIRVMSDSFFILLRYFLRVDNLFVRINDTRLYYELDKDYILREFSSRQSNIQDLEEVPLTLLSNPSELWNHLPDVKDKCFQEKLEVPSN